MKLTASKIAYAARRFEEIERDNTLTVENGKVRPTVAFLKAASQAFSLTPTQSWQLWIYTFNLIERLAEKHRRDADIAFTFKIDPHGLSEAEKIAYLANLPRLKAQKRLDEGDYDPTDYNGVYALTLLATGDELRAVKARSKAQWRLLDKAGRKR